MLEVKVLSAFLESRKEYEYAHEYVQDFSPMGRAVLEEITNYYEADPEATYVDLDLLASNLELRFGAVPKHVREARDYVTEIQAMDTSTVNVTKVLVEAEKYRIGSLLSSALATQDEERTAQYLQEYTEVCDKTGLSTEVEESYTGIDLSEFEEMYDEDNLIRVAPLDLNRRLRNGLIRGFHLVLVAMPETGKSLFALNMASGFIQQGLRVLYVGNEDPLPELVLRLLSNLSGIDGDELFNNKDLVMERALERGYKNITFKGLAPGNIQMLDSLLRKDEYDVLIVDQLRNLEGKSENNTTRLETICRGVRDLGRKHNVLAVSVTQGAESARDQLVLNSGDVDGSNIGIPGACDIMVMVGVNDEYYANDLRKVTLTKNKRGGLHESFTVRIDRDKSRILNYTGAG
jgi:archaellum biogenesis ATPase FlaH